MYEVHVQEGIVLGKRAIREADLLVDVLTPTGLVRARALGARKEASKLRYGLEPLTCGRYSFVHGREVRLTGASGIDRRYLAPCLPAGRAALARVARLLMRLVPGVEPNPELFSTVSAGFDALAEAPHAPEPTEVVLVLRILSHLGYLPRTEALAPFVDGAFSLELSAKALEARGLLIKIINESLRASGL